MAVENKVLLGRSNSFPSASINWAILYSASCVERKNKLARDREVHTNPDQTGSLELINDYQVERDYRSYEEEEEEESVEREYKTGAERNGIVTCFAPQTFFFFFCFFSFTILLLSCTVPFKGSTSCWAREKVTAVFLLRLVYPTTFCRCAFKESERHVRHRGGRLGQEQDR